MYMWYFLVIIAVVLIVITMKKNKTKENWQTYKQLPFKSVDTGADPLYYYPMKQYRKPYRWPLTFYQSYPYSHMTAFDNIMGSG